MLRSNESNENVSLYRYYKPETHYSRKLSLKFEVDQESEFIFFSIAVCSEQDNFSRKKARELLDERMSNDEYYCGHYDRDKSLIDNAVIILRDFVKLKQDPDISELSKQRVAINKRFVEAKRFLSAFSEITEEIDVEEILNSIPGSGSIAGLGTFEHI